MRYALFLALVAVAASLPATAAAQSIPSPYRYIETTQAAGVFAGYLQTDRGDFGIGPHSAPMLGARYDIRFTGPLSGEVVLGAVPTTRTVVQRYAVTSDSTALRDLEDVDALILTAEAGLRFQITGPRTWNGFAPYAVATGGLFADVLGTAAVEETIEASQRVELGPAFGAGVGLGTDWHFSDRFSLRLDARDHLWRLAAPEGLTGTRARDTEWTHNFAVTLGASLHF